MAYITEQLATGHFIKRGPGYVLSHKTNKGEVINFLGCFPSQTTVYQKLGNGRVSLTMVRLMVGFKRGFPNFIWARMIFKPGCLLWILHIERAPFDFHFWMEYIVTYLTAPGRCPVEIDQVKSQGAPQRTARALTGCTHHFCRAPLINKCIVL